MDRVYFHGRNSVERRNYEIGVGAGEQKIGLLARPLGGGMVRALVWTMTLSEARRYARHILRQVEVIEAAQKARKEARR